MSKPPKKEMKKYAFWEEQDDGTGYFEDYDTISEAVRSCYDQDVVEVFEVTYKSVGFYKETHGVRKLTKNEIKKLEAANEQDDQ